MHRRAALALLLLAFASAGGCRTTDPALERSRRAVDMLVDTRRSLANSEQVVADSQATLRVLGEPSLDLEAAFVAFKKQAARVRQEADRLRLEAAVVRSESKRYSEARESDVGKIYNEGMRQAAGDRTREIVGRYERINELYGVVNAAFTEYVRDLDDLQTFLSNDLNHPALQSARRWLGEAAESGQILRGGIRDLTEEQHTTSNLLSPTPVPATAWGTAATSPATQPE